MSRLFDDASNQYLQLDSAPISGYPFTLVAWFYTDDDTASQTILGLADKDVNNHKYRLAVRGDQGDKVEAHVHDGGSASNARTSTTFSANTWHHACGVFASSTDRRAYLDNGGENSNGSDKTPLGLDSVAIGRTNDSSPGAYMSGRLAEVCIYNVALGSDARGQLAAGFSPLLVQPQNIAAYWPLIRDEDQDIVGGYDLTAFNSPTVADHPPIIYPTSPYIVVPVAVAPPAVGAIMTPNKGFW